MSLVLAIDTSAAACSVAVLDRERVHAHCTRGMDRGHAEALLPMVAEAMGAAGVAFARLDLVAVTRGPGAFTGIRIGLAAARGLSFAAGKPCLGVETLEALAEPVLAGRPGRAVLAAMDTKRGDFYAQVFDASAASAPGMGPAAVDAAGLHRLAAGWSAGERPLLVVGDAQDAAVTALAAAGMAVDADPACRVPDVRAVGRIALARWRPGEAVEAPKPLYLRPPQVSEPDDRR